ncbi:MAG: hypothetical protein H0X37_15065 [Herpetosiphonaceae bacterium]|nr:hypothetical protein [Herpetosiphonaceae bacterium]
MQRKLTPLERVAWLADQQNSGRAGMTARIRGRLTVDQLKDALSAIQRKHWLLTVRIVVDDAEWPAFVADAEGVPELRVRMVDREHDDDWVREAQAELLQPFAAQGELLVRFVWLQSKDVSDLIVVIHHVVADAISMMNLFRDLLTQLADPSVVIEPQPMLPPLEELIPSPLRIRLLAASITGVAGLRKAGHRLEQLRHKLPFQKPVREPAGPTSRAAHMNGSAAKTALTMLTWVLAEDDTTELIAACKRERTTVHAAMCTAFLLALRDIEGKPIGTLSKVQSPVNIRDRLTQPASDAFGLFILLVQTDVDCRPGREFWEIAREFKQRMERATSDTRLFVRSLLVQKLMVKWAETKSNAELARLLPWRWSGCDMTVSNIGRLKLPSQYGPLQLEAIYGPFVSPGRRERTLLLSTFNERLSMTFMSWAPGGNLVKAERIKAEAMLQLGTAVGWQMQSSVANIEVPATDTVGSLD